MQNFILKRHENKNIFPKLSTFKYYSLIFIKIVKNFIMVNFGFCDLTLAPVKADASDKSEMVSQLLFGETFRIIDSYEQWKLIRGAFDNYEGWIDEKQFMPITENKFFELQKITDIFPKKLISEVVDDHNNSAIKILSGSNLNGIKGNILSIEGRKFLFSGESFPMPEKPNRKKIAETAREFINAPYLWGGRSLFGFDCSGFVQIVFKINGIRLNRDATYQARQGEAIHLISESNCGDLAFFDDEENNIIHVGIILEDENIIHASGKVRIDKIDHQGIFNVDKKKYTHKLRLITNVAGN